MAKRKQGIYEKFIKRGLDLICSLIVIVFFWWVYVIIAVLVRVKLGSPVLFKQERPGKDEKIFKLYKFRTMTDARDGDGNLLPDEQRLTGFGKTLRATSLDELPEIFNILKGEMSLIGPRPLLVRYLPRYNETQHRRHEVRPGLSGWAQVNGRNAISWEEKFEHDVWYVDHISFGLDMKIILMTVQKAFLSHDGISSATSATMEEFMGSENVK
ncbi:MAG: sugar transferase [Lachnospiraceae bacterium]|nr:sugar transferase [Lachnospiraceae bacterium]